MNCANHPNAVAVAYCRTCGKPLCAACTRDVKGVIYCENCLADRLAGVQPAVVPPLGPGVVSGAPVVPSSGPNPGLAGVLAAIPFGVGAVYNGQYAKGLAHMLIFLGLFWGMDQDGTVATLSGCAFVFFYIYQIIEAVRSAKAIQVGQPAPDPFGLGEAFGAGGKTDVSRIPVGAVVLIGLGVLFLLQNMGVFEFSVGRIAPFLCIALGLWLFAKRWGWIPSSRMYSHADRMRGLTGPVVLVTLGVLSLIEDMGGPRWHHTWPILLLAIGIIKLLERQGPTLPPPAVPGSSGAGSAGSSGVQPPVSEVHNG